MDSPLSSAVSISSLPSEVSGEMLIQCVSSTSLSHINSPDFEPNEKALFEPGDGDMELIVNGTRFETHRYLIKRFKKWRDLNPKLRSGAVITVAGAVSPEDFSRMLRVLYATTLEGPFEFDITTLVSALYFATEYEYPALRDYAIRHLERANLTAIKRIELARKFNLQSWEKPAYIDLCNRDEAITEEEANILGMAAFVRIAKIREQEQRRRGREEMGLEKDTADPERPMDDNGNGETVNEPPKVEEAAEAEELVPMNSSEETSEGPQTLAPDPHPSFATIPTGGTYQRGEYKSIVGSTKSVIKLHGLPVPGCQCRYVMQGIFGDVAPVSQICQLPACAAAAFKNLQAQQKAHEKNIMDLEASLKKVEASLESPGLNHAKEEIATPTSQPHDSIQEQVCEMLKAIRSSV